MGFSGWEKTELWCVGLSNNDQPSALQPNYKLTIMVRRKITQEGRPRCRSHTFEKAKQVLEKKGHSGKWSIS
jgi:hypothetical protein